MQKIPVEMVTEDMKSAKTIKAHDGSPLVCPGEPLTAELTRRLTMAGVMRITVQGNPLPGYDMGYDVEKRLERVPYLFRNFTDDKAMMQFSSFLISLFAERRNA